MSDNASMDHDQKALAEREEVTLVGGETIWAHPAETCAGSVCCIHRPSNHHMADWPQQWHTDDGIMERVCPHQKRHPDPDHMAYALTKPGPVGERPSGVHTCDGCCQSASHEDEPSRFAFHPDWALHPGQHLDEWIEYSGQSVADLARATGIHISQLSLILAGVGSIGDDVAHRLAGHTGIPAQLWLNFQARYDKHNQVDGTPLPEEADAAWQPGDPVHAIESASTQCPSCGASWTPAGPDLPCPECELPLSKHQLTEELCSHAVARHRTVDRMPNSIETISLRVSWIGQITGLRIALCTLHGWDPSVDAGKDGKADELVTQWWKRQYPDEWQARQDKPGE